MALSQLVSPITVLRCNWYELLATGIGEGALMVHSVVHLMIIRRLDGLDHVARCCGALGLLA